MNHVEYDWESSLMRHFYVALARDFTLLRYDARGNGLSDWDVNNVSLDAWVSDLETVVNAAGFDRFPLLAMSQGCAISVAFAVRHPGRESHLILYGGFARGAYRRAKNELELQKAKALATLIRTGWGEETPGIPSTVLITVYAGRDAGAASKICRATTQDDHSRICLPLLRDHEEP
jgi:pimeloyl-ACP methyl ester carboxylesterase